MLFYNPLISDLEVYDYWSTSGIYYRLIQQVNAFSSCICSIHLFILMSINLDEILVFVRPKPEMFQLFSKRPVVLCFLGTLCHMLLKKLPVDKIISAVHSSISGLQAIMYTKSTLDLNLNL